MVDIIRVGILVEGTTEEIFVKKLLYDYLQPKGIYVTPIKLNGCVNIDKIAKYLNRMANKFDKVTTLVDFYGFRGKTQYETKASLEQRILKSVSEKIRHKVIPYVQMYEFEALLFSNPDILADGLGHPEFKGPAKKILESADNNPEKINNSKETAPSKRLEKVGYRKTTHGPDIAGTIGIDNMRAKCPGFNRWITELEALSQPNHKP
ncbi:MAG: DUF4276 family protein [Endozoicomonadaceae bacterium]|nr:DUF4276 family protein [Endozoicomonadaceae bacterium]